MNRLKYITVFFVGTLIYVLLSITVGQNSIRSLKMMEEQKRIVSKQKSDIQNINNELKMELSALQTDNAVIAAYARKLDYVSEGEKLVKITGLKPMQSTLYDTGTVVRHEDPEFISEVFCKLSGLIVGFLWFIILLLVDISHGRVFEKKRKESVVTGIPIYDLEQI